MKALLKFGPLSGFLDVPERKDIIYIPHPAGMLGVREAPYGQVTATTDNKQIEFEFYREEMIDDVKIWVYHYKAIK